MPFPWNFRMFCYLDFRCYFETNGQNHIHFRLMQVLKNNMAWHFVTFTSPSSKLEFVYPPCCGVEKQMLIFSWGKNILDQIITHMSGIYNKAVHLPPLGKSDRQCMLAWITSVYFESLVGTLSIDSENVDDDASKPRQTGPRVSFSAGKTKFKQCCFPDRRRLFLCDLLFFSTTWIIRFLFVAQLLFWFWNQKWIPISNSSWLAVTLNFSCWRETSAATMFSHNCSLSGLLITTTCSGVHWK